MHLISPDLIQTAFDFMVENEGPEAAAIKAHRDAEFERKRIRARLILDSDEKSLGLRECEAECDPAYKAACDKVSETEAALAQVQRRYKNSNLIVELWRTQQANERNLARVA